MRIINFKFWLAILLFAAVMFTTSRPACADTFQVFDLGIDRGSIVGIDDSGTVVIRSFEVPDPHFDWDYEIWVGGVEVSQILSNSLIPPSLNYDNGSPCIPTTSGGVTLNSFAPFARCNNGHEVYEGSHDSSPSRGIFTGPNLSDLLEPNLPYPSSLFFTGEMDPTPDLNAFGDFAWDDPGGDEFFEAIDLTTSQVPETGSFFLLGTGALTILRAVRHRRFC